MAELVKLMSAISNRGRDPQSSILDPPPSILNPRSSGKEYWRSLEELADSEEFQEALHREFPENATEWNDPVGRRRFLKLMGASFALAGLTACTRQPTEYIAPYVRQPEELVPGKAVYFATAMPLEGFATGLIVESHEGRPTKIEGNKDHPASLGATDVFSQASVLGLYDPDRSQTLTYLGDIVTWSAFLGAVAPAVNAQKAMATQQTHRAGLRILTETVSSPTLAYQLKTLLATLPTAKWHQYDAAGRDNVREGSRLAFGQYANAVYHFDKADVVVSLDSDFLACGPATLRYARDFASRRRPDNNVMNRLYVVESTVTNTGSVADHRLPMKPSEIEGVALALASSLGVQAASTSMDEPRSKQIAAIAKDLREHRGSSIVIAGDSQPPVVHALAHAMNATLGNASNTVVYTDPVEASPVDGNTSLRELVADMNAGQVDVLLILGGNPVYNAPADLDFATAIRKVPLRIHLSLYKDETSELCQWHVPEAHYLESWSDARAYDGTVSIIQPLIAPLYSGKSAHEVLAAFLGEPERAGYDIVRDYWRRRFANGGQEPPVAAAIRPPAETQSVSTAPPPASAQAQTSAGSFEQSWRKSLHDGLVANTALQPKTVAIKADWSNVGTSPQPPTPNSRLCFGPIRRFTTGDSPTTAGFRNCPSRLAS